MAAGFPDGTPLRHGLTFTYNHFAAVRFLRASYKAAPLLAVALACLAGVGAGRGCGRRLGPCERRGVAGGASASPAGPCWYWAAWPLVTGPRPGRPGVLQAGPRRLARRRPRDLNRELPANSRAMVLPGDLFSFYTWGGTVDPILPALSKRPVAERSEVPYSRPARHRPAVDDRRPRAPAAACCPASWPRCCR